MQASLFLLALGTFAAGTISSITGGTSLLTVPLLLLAGIDAQQAIATNMLVVTALSGSAATRFLLARVVPLRPTSQLTLTAVPGSVLGAVLALKIDDNILRLIISSALLVMALVSAIRPSLGEAPRSVHPRAEMVGYVALGFLAIYGGLFSGGYATLLTFGIVLFFGRALTEAIAISKVVNFVGSAVASAVFIRRGAVRWDLVPWLGTAAALGAWCGAAITLRARPEQIRRLFTLVVAALGIKIGYDSFRSGHSVPR